MDQFKHEFSELTRGHKMLAIIVAILMIGLGMTSFFAPFLSTSIIIWLFIIGVIIYGVFLIFTYAKSAVKNGWTLASGIMSLILGILLIFSEPLSKADTFAFMLAFVTLTSGINQIMAASLAKKSGAEKTGWLTVSGVINVVLAFFFIANPFIMLFAFDIIVAVYLIFGGITIFAITCSSK